MRFAAYLADALLLLIPEYLIDMILRISFATETNIDQYMVEIMLIVLSILIWWIYCAGFNSSVLQGTPGKKLCSLKVVDYDGNRISFGKASIRYFSSILSCCIMIVGYLMVIWTERRQALHDMIAGTVVVKV